LLLAEPHGNFASAAVDFLAGGFGQRSGLFNCLDPSPFVSSIAGFAFCVTISEAVEAVLSKVCITAAAALRDLNEAQGDKLADCRRDGLAIKPVLHKVLIGRRQMPVFVSPVMSVLDLDPRENLMGGATQDAEGGRFQHCDRPRRKLSRDPVALMHRRATLRDRLTQAPRPPRSMTTPDSL
jgi:hypothetical protein